jgi:hypothetical protein
VGRSLGGVVCMTDIYFEKYIVVRFFYFILVGTLLR